MGVATGAAVPTSSVRVLAEVPAASGFVNQIFPEPSMASTATPAKAPLSYPYPFVPVMGVPVELNSLTEFPSAFATHAFPAPSMARPIGLYKPPPL